MGSLQHALNYGADSFHDQVGTTGFGTIFTPSGERTVSGSFAQLKTNYANALETMTAVRYDKYSLSGGGVGTQGDRVSPKITVGLTTIPGFTPYFIYAEGYRAPALTETLVAGIHPASPQFTFLPNPGLKPEVGRNTEFRINTRYDSVLRPGDAFRAKANVYRNYIDNYINLQRPDALGRMTGKPTCIGIALCQAPPARARRAIMARGLRRGSGMDDCGAATVNEET